MMKQFSPKISRVTAIGILCALFGFFLIGYFSQKFPDTLPPIYGLMLSWLLTILLLGLVKMWEKRPFSTIGLTTISWKDALLAVGIGIILSLTVPLLTLLVAQFMPAATEGSIEALTQQSWLLILAGVITAAVCEEIVFRGYLIERLLEIGVPSWLTIMISLIAFTLPHLFNWNMTHVVGVVLPLGLALTGLYFWRRHLLFNIIVHFVIDLPLVFFALAAN